MADLATLGFEIDSSSVKQATLDLRALPDAASASERAAQKLGVTMTSAGATSEEFSRRVLRNIDTLKFQADQLNRTSAEQERFTALRRAGVTAESAAGQAVSASVAALQAQRQAAQASADAAREQAAAARVTEETNKRAASAVQAVTAALDFEMAQLGRTAVQRAQYEAVRRAGVAADSAEARSIMTKVAALEAEKVAFANLQAAELAAARAAGTTGMTAQQRLILGYQLNDIFTGLTTGQSPMMIAAQQGPQITQIFGGVKNTLAAIPKSYLIGGGAALGVAGIAAAISAVKDLSNAADEQKRRLTALLGSQEMAASAYSAITKEAISTGVAIADVSTAFSKFTTATQSLGASTPQNLTLSSISAQLAKLGGSTPEETTAGASAISKVLSESVVSADSLKAIFDSMPLAAKTIADGLGVSVTQLKLMAQQGDLTNRQVFTSLLDQTGKIQKGFDLLPGTVGSVFRGLITEAEDFAASLYKSVVNIQLISDKRKQLGINGPTSPMYGGAFTGGSPYLTDDSKNFRPPGTLEGQLNNNGSNYLAPDDITAQYQDAIRAVASAASAAVLAASQITDKLDPLLSDMRSLQQQIDDVTKGLDALQGGMSGLDTMKAASETKRLTDALQFLRDRAMEAKTAYGQALDAVSTRQQQDELGYTPGRRSYEARVKQLMDSQPGVTRDAAATVVDFEQIKSLDDMIAKQQQELAAQTAITQAMKGGRAAADDASIAMRILGISIDQLGNITPEAKERLDQLAKLMRDTAAQARAQASIDASKPLITELESIAAAMKVVEQGAYAMKRAQAEVKAARDENGTGGLQMQVFDAQQALTDKVALDNLDKSIALTNALAAAAGDVAEQKRIQLDYDIKIAQLAAGPGAQAAIAEKMRADFTAKANLELRNGTADLQKQVDLSEQQLAILRSGAPDQAAQLAVLAKRNELLAKGVDLTTSDAQQQIDLAAKKARIDEQLQWEKDAADATKRTWMNAYDNIQSFGADSFYGIFTGATVNGQSAAQSLKNIFYRTFADIAAAAIIRPIITPIFQAGASMGLIPNGVVPAATGSTGSMGGMGSTSGGGGLSGLSSLGSSGGGWLGNQFSGISSFMNSPVFGIGGSVTPGFEAASSSPYAFADLSGAYGGLGGAAAPTGAMGGLTWGSALGGLGSIGMGAYSLLSGKGGIGSTLGGAAQIAGGVMMMIPGLQPVGAVLSLLGGLGGLFGGGGPQIPPMPGLNYQQGTFGYDANGRVIGSGDYSSGAKAVGQQALDLISATGGKAIADRLYGGTFASGTTHTWDGQQWVGQDYTQANIRSPDGTTSFIGGTGAGVSVQDAADRLAAEVFRQDVLNDAISGISQSLSDTLKTIFTNLSGATTQATQDAVNFAKAYDQLGKAANPVKDSIEQLNAKFRQMSQQADAYGLALDPINDELAKQTKRTAQDFIDSMLDPLAVQMRALDDERQSALASAQYIKDNVEGVYVDMDRIVAYYTTKQAQMVDQFYGGAVESLQAAIDRIKPGGDLANLDPTGTLTGLKATYESTLAQAMANDPTAVANLANAGTQYLDFYKSYSGGDAQYTAVRDSVLAAFQQIQAAIQIPANNNGAALDVNNPGIAQLTAQVQQFLTAFQQSQADSAKKDDRIATLTGLLSRYVKNQAA